MGCSSSKKKHDLVTPASNSNLVIKFAIVGPKNVGKTSMMNAYVDGKFVEDDKATVIDYKTKDTVVKGQKVRVVVMDTAGQERFRSITQSFYRGVSGLILVFDLNDETSFEAMDTWIEELKEYADDNSTIALVGNKSDKQKVVDSTKAQNFVRDYRLEGYYETSAKENTNIETVFNAVLEKAIQPFL